VAFMDFAIVRVAQIAIGIPFCGTGEGIDRGVQWQIGPIETAPHRRGSRGGWRSRRLRSVDSCDRRFWARFGKPGYSAITYSLHPDDAPCPSTDGVATVDNYLREDLLNRLTNGPLKCDSACNRFAD